MELIYYFNHDLLLDFRTIRNRVPSIPPSTLYRLLRNKYKCNGVRYNNRLLYKYRDLLEIPEVCKELKSYEI